VTRAILGGGIDRQLAALAAGLGSRGHRIAVATFFGGDGGPFHQRLRETGETLDAGVRGRWDLPRLVTRTGSWIRARRPDVVYGLNVETNLLALLIGRLPPRPRVVWGLRWEDPGIVAADRRGRAAARLHERLGRAADLVIASSHAAGDYARRIRVPEARLRIIRNGIDTQEFTAHPSERARVRAEWQVEEHETLIGTVGLDPLKRHEAFLRAAQLFADRRPESRFVLVGRADHDYHERLRTLAAELGLSERTIWTGQRDDMCGIYNALDLTTLLSRSEGTPNSVAESMACGVPCVVSDVGDARDIIGDDELVLHSVDPGDVANAWAQALGRPWAPDDRGSLRRRIETLFGLERMVAEQEVALESLL
jgi:glycosyltransferase involved in cell wall biosynthesis